MSSSSSSSRNINSAMTSFHKGNNPMESLERFEKYIHLAKLVFKRTDISTDVGMIDMLQSWGGEDMKRLFMNTGGVEEHDSFEEAIQKIKAGLTSMINRVYPMYELFHGMPQGDQVFVDWVGEVLKHAKSCPLDDYTPERAARDAIVIQTTDERLRKIVLKEGLGLKEMMELGKALELEAMEVDEDNQEG